MLGRYFDLNDALLALEADGYEQRADERHRYVRPSGDQVLIVQHLGGEVELRRDGTQWEA